MQNPKLEEEAVIPSPTEDEKNSGCPHPFGLGSLAYFMKIFDHVAGGGGYELWKTNGAYNIFLHKDYAQTVE